ncbi:MAG: prepilin-type N-terminal cleavage/methylation domain-containing protein [Clostridiales Family XIII bacterium]|jgi:prepilin-type N-terminal cleavage/methylation domain-containing protein|nr:prepilin-type N-terminal cleavage/methylation domain-containing protein [Clostridiales Family XIII bacterium]
MKMTSKRKLDMDKHGFTLVEVIVVLVIIVIISGLAVPNLIGSIQKNRVKEIVLQATNAEDEVMALTGKQYAMTADGNPPVGTPVTGSAIENAAETHVTVGGINADNDYVYIDSSEYTIGSSPSKSVALVGLAGKGRYEYERNTISEQNPDDIKVFINADTSGLDKNVATFAQPIPPTYVTYPLLYSWIDLEANGKNYRVYHNIWFGDNKNPTESDMNKSSDWASKLTEKLGWHVYEMNADGSGSYVASR